MKRTVTFLVITLLVLVLVWWFEVRPATKVRSTDEREQATKSLVGIAAKEEIKGFTLRKEGAEAITVESVNEEWFLRAPVAASAEEARVKEVLWDLEWTEKEMTIEAGELTEERLASYGFDKPAGLVDVVTTSGVKHFVVGGPNPGGDLVYVREGDEGPVHLVKKGFAENLDKTPFDMRNKTIVPLVPAQVGFIKLFGATKAELTKESGFWDLTDPFEDYADPETVNKFLETANKLKALSFVSEAPGGYDQYGLPVPDAPTVAEVATYVKVAEGKGGGKVVTAYFGKEAPPGEDGRERVYGCLQGQRPVFTLDAATVKSLFVTVAELQSGEVTRMDPYALKKVTATHALDQVEFARRDFDWQIVKPFEAKAESQAVRELLDTFNDAKISEYITPEPVESRYGLDVPRGSFSFVEGDKQPVGIIFGREAGEGLIYAKRTDTPGAFTVSTAVFDKLATPALAYHTREMQRISMDEAREIEIRRGENVYKLKRGESGFGPAAWRMSEPAEAPANSGLVSRLLLNLATTRAADLIERLPKDLTPYGLDAPAVSIRVSGGTPEGGQPKAILVGKGAADGARYAMLEGGQIVFTIDEEYARVAVDEIRDSGVFSFERAGASQVELRSGETVYVLKKEADEWRVESPEGYSVRSAAVEDELQHVSELETIKFVRYRTEKLEEYGLEKPRAVVRIVTPSGAAALSVGEMAESGFYYATSTSVDGVFLLTPGDLINVLDPLKLIEQGTPLQPAGEPGDEQGVGEQSAP